MLSRVQYWILLGTAVVVLIVTGSDVAIYASNASIQKQFNANNQYLQQTVQQQSIYQEMAKALADLASSRNDEQLAELLAKHGMTVALRPAPAPTAATKPGSQATAGPASSNKSKGVR